jgi:uroporphyrin-III C-methyltransferase / precorrin-2 dehydrogenase / sirohydrochlorin ferrochelatase
MRKMPPRETRPARTGPLAVLPVFVDLRGRRVVVAGDGDALLWKVELLAAAGADVAVFTNQQSPELDALSASPPAGSLAVTTRRWHPTDLQGAALAVGALTGSEAKAFREAACQHGVPINIVDSPQVSTFSFGSIVNRSPLVIGISTAGAAPVLAQLVRAKIEALLHPVLGAWTEAARQLRAQINVRFGMGAARREVWRRFAELALVARAAPRRDILSRIAAPHHRPCGSIVLVGAGPGDPELLTIKALRALQSADIILYDRLISPEILELARREARRMLVGKTGNGASCRQDEINALMLKLAREGQRVVRLKGGDPMLFGRAAEEIEACCQAGIPVEVVPGITAAFGAAAELQTPLTDRSGVRRLQFVTGHGHNGEIPDYDWRTLADEAATTAFYMSGRTFAGMLPKLIDAGLDAEAPALAIVAATTPRSRHIRCAVCDLPAALPDFAGPEPCLILIGRTLGDLAKVAVRQSRSLA